MLIGHNSWLILHYSVLYRTVLVHIPSNACTNISTTLVALVQQGICKTLTNILWAFILCLNVFRYPCNMSEVNTVRTHHLHIYRKCSHIWCNGEKVVASKKKYTCMYMYPSEYDWYIAAENPCHLDTV